MSRPDSLVALRLYAAPLRRSDGLARLLRAQAGRACPRLLGLFAFKNDERRFALRLLELHARFWLFRTHQARFAGDFVAVDMSERRVARRRAFCVDLKLGAKLSEGGGGAGNAFVGLPRVVGAIAQGTRVLAPDHTLTRLAGDAERVLARLAGDA